MDGMGIIIGAVLYLAVLAILLPIVCIVYKRDRGPVNYDDRQW